MSDTHNHITNIRKAVQIFNDFGVSRCFHAGDIYAPYTFDEFNKLCCPADFVLADKDYPKKIMTEAFRGKGNFYEGRASFCLEGKNLLMMHEPVALETIENVSRYDCIIYGHTHREDIREVNGILLINPGEVCGYFTDTGSVVILEVPSMKVDLITFKPDPLDIS